MYPQPQQGKDIKWKERAIYLLNEKGNLKVRLLSFVSTFMLNKDVTMCLNAESPNIFGDAEVFTGLKEILEKNGFYLNDKGFLCKNST